MSIRCRCRSLVISLRLACGQLWPLPGSRRVQVAFVYPSCCRCYCYSFVLTSGLPRTMVRTRNSTFVTGRSSTRHADQLIVRGFLGYFGLVYSTLLDKAIIAMTRRINGYNFITKSPKVSMSVPNRRLIHVTGSISEVFTKGTAVMVRRLKTFTETFRGDVLRYDTIR